MSKKKKSQAEKNQEVRSGAENEEQKQSVKLLYDVNEKPKSLEWLILSLQHVFAMFGATVLVPILVNQGIKDGGGGELLSIAVALVTAGIGTLLYILCTKGKSPVFLGISTSDIVFRKL